MSSATLNRRVLHVITTIGRGGAENHLMDLISGQLAAGWSVDVAFLKADGDRYWRGHLESLGVKTMDLRLGRYGEIAPALRLRGFLRQRAPAIIHAHMPPAELYTRLALIGDATPLVISKHLDTRFFDGPGSTRVERWCARRASKIIAISDAVLRHFADRWPADLRNRLVRIHYGLDPRPYQADRSDAAAVLRDQWGVRPGEIVIGTVSRLTPQKALDVMMLGFRDAARAWPDQPMKLVIVGRGNLLDSLKSFASSLGLENEVVLAGYIEDIPAAMQAFDLFALTSVYEGFGLVLLEAMSSSRAVVATNASAIPEVVADGVSGMLMPIRDPAAFAHAIGELMDPSRRDALGQAGLRRVVDVFSPGVMVDKTVAEYEAVLARA